MSNTMQQKEEVENAVGGSNKANDPILDISSSLYITDQLVDSNFEVPATTAGSSNEHDGELSITANHVQSTVSACRTMPSDEQADINTLESSSESTLQTVSIPPPSIVKDATLELKHVCNSTCVGGCSAKIQKNKPSKYEGSTSLENSGNYSFATSSLSSLESSVEVDNKDQSFSSNSLSEDGSSKRAFLAVKDRYCVVLIMLILVTEIYF